MLFVMLFFFIVVAAGGGGGFVGGIKSIFVVLVSLSISRC